MADAIEIGDFATTVQNLTANLPHWLDIDVAIEFRLYGKLVVDDVRALIPPERAAILLGVDPDEKSITIDNGMGDPLRIDGGMIDGFFMRIIPLENALRLSKRPV